MRAHDFNRCYSVKLFIVAISNFSKINSSKWSIVIFFFLISISTYAQPIFKAFDTENGLSSNTVTAIVQDQSGYLWIGTEDGLNRFNGTLFKSYHHSAQNKNSIASNVIYSMAVDKSDRIWLGHPSGVTRFDPSINEFTRYKIDSAAKWSTVRFVDKHDRVWVTVSDNTSSMVALNSENGRIEKRIDLTPFIKTYIHITSALEDSQGNFWIGTNVGLFLYESKSSTVKPIPFNDDSGKPRVDFITEIMMDKQGGVWFDNTREEICYYSPKQNSFVVFTVPKPFSDPKVVLDSQFGMDIAWKSDNEIWFINSDIGKSIGIFNIQTKSFSFIPVPNSYEEWQGLKLIVNDRNGVIWLATAEGIAMMNPFDTWNFKPHYKSNSLLRIRAVLEDTVVEKKFIAEDNLGLIVSSFDSSQERTFKNTFVIQDFLNTSGDSIWVLSRDDIRLFNKVKEEWIDHPWLKKINGQLGPNSSNFRRMIKTVSGDYWIASQTNGAFYLSGEDFSFKNFRAETADKNSICSNRLYSLQEDKFGRIWFTSIDKGVSIFDPATNTFKTLNNDKEGNSFLPTNFIGDMDIDKDGNVLLATLEVGIIKINLIKKDSMRIEPFDNELLTSGVYELKIDEQERVWVLTKQGVNVLDTKTMIIKSFVKKNGLFDLHRCFFKLNGHILLNGTIGYGSIDEKDLWVDSTANPLLINIVKVFGKEVSPKGPKNDHINLPYDQNSFAIDFEAIDLVNSDKIRYSYKLEGLEGSDWSAPSRNKGTEFASLPGGDYIFKLKASNQDGVWSTEKNLLYIHVETPFWKTTWFYFLVVLACISITALLYYYQLNRNKRVAQLQLKALHTQMRPHFIFNCLSAINSHIIKFETVKASEFLSQFSRLMRGILENSTESWITLEQEIETLRLYLVMEGLRFDDRLSYNIEVEEGINPSKTLIPSMILQPYVENAIGHGLLHKQHGTGIVSIKFLRGDGNLKCIIEDNGIGRERASQIKKKSLTSRKSLGLQITSERLQLLQGKSLPDIQDLKNEMGEPIGTRIVVMLMTKKIDEKEVAALN